MDTDLILVIGMFVGILAIPSILSAFSESRPPRTGMTMVLIAGVLIVVATRNHMGGYSMSELPDVVIRTIGRYLN